MLIGSFCTACIATRREELLAQARTSHAAAVRRRRGRPPRSRSCARLRAAPLRRDGAPAKAGQRNKYGAGGTGRLAAAEAVATSADEEVVYARGREDARGARMRDAELRGEAVSLDE